MSTVIKFPGHKRERCRNEECDGRCVLCNLYCCVTCGGAEASLPAHCPGKRMDALMCACIQDGTADYVDGMWHFKLRHGEKFNV